MAFDNWDGLFTFQSFCGASRTRAPFAPPLLSEPLYGDADAQAVETNWDTESPDLAILDFRFSKSLFVSLNLFLGTGSCQRFFGTSLPK